MNKRERRKYYRKYHLQHRDKSIAYSKSYRKRHAMALRDYDKKYYDQHKSERHSYRLKYYKRKKSYFKNYNKSYYVTNNKLARAKLPASKFSSYKCNATARGYAFSLTFDEFMAFWQKPCTYCADSIATIGIDRKDNTGGYYASNICACCTTCNVIKGSRYSYKDMLIIGDALKRVREAER